MTGTGITHRRDTDGEDLAHRHCHRRRHRHSALTASTAEAICQNSEDNYRRLVVAQSRTFHRQRSTRFINDVFVTYNAVGVSPIYNDCGAGASSTIPGVSVQANYCPWWGTCSIAPAGTWAAVDKSQPDSNSPPPGTYRYYEEDHLRPIAVIYDGTSPAGRSGRVDIATTDEWGNPVVIIGHVNVYIRGTCRAHPWFIATSAANSIQGATLALDSSTSTAGRTRASLRCTIAPRTIGIT